MWVDEYLTWWIVSPPSLGEVIDRALKVPGQSPFYSILVKLFTDLTGVGPFQLRLPSVILGTATLTLVYPLALHILHDRRVALTSVIVFVLSERLIWHSQSARPYALALLLTTLSFLTFFWINRSNKPMQQIAYVVVNTLLVYSQFVFSLVLGVHLITLIVTKGWREICSKTWVTLYICIAVLCIPVGKQLIDLFEKRHVLSWVDHLDDSNMFVEPFMTLFSMCHPLVFLPTLAAVLFSGFRRNDLIGMNQQSGLRLLWWWLIPPFVLLITTPLLIGIRFFHSRYLLFTYPAAFLLIAWFLNQTKRTDWRKRLPLAAYIASSIIFILAPNFTRFGAFSFRNQWDWENAVRIMVASANHQDFVVYRTGLVEADSFATVNTESYLHSYVAWPITANLPPGKSFPMVGLPFRLAEQTQNYFSSVQKTAGEYDRVWVIGEGALTAFFVEKMLLSPRFQRLYHSTHGQVQVTLLKKRAFVP